MLQSSGYLGFYIKNKHGYNKGFKDYELLS